MNLLQQLVTVYVNPLSFGRADAQAAGDTTPPPPQPVGVFVTPQSIVTFPIASAVVTIVWKVLGAVIPSWETSRLIPLLIAFAVGFLIYIIGLTSSMTTREKVVQFALAILNSFCLASSALGIGTVL